MVVIGLFAGYTWYSNAQWVEATFTNPAVAIKYHRDIIPTDLAVDTAVPLGTTEVLFRAEKTGEMPLLISLRKETGLLLVTSLTKASLIDNLLRNVERAFPLRFSNYIEFSRETSELNGRQTATIVFTYAGPTGEIIKQRLLIVAYDADTALYLSAQAQAKEFDSLERRYFNKIFESLKFR